MAGKMGIAIRPPATVAHLSLLALTYERETNILNNSPRLAYMYNVYIVI